MDLERAVAFLRQVMLYVAAFWDHFGRNTDRKHKDKQHDPDKAAVGPWA